MSIFNHFGKKKLAGQATPARCFTDRVTFRETCLGSVTDIAALTISPDGKREAYTVKRGDKRAVALDGMEGQLYDGIGAGSLTFSPDGTRVAYAAEQGGRWLTVVDGVEFPPSVGPFVFSPDSRHIAFTQKVGNRECLLLDGCAGQEYECVDSIGFLRQVPTNSDQWEPTYIAKRGRKFFLVRGTEEGKDYDQIGSLFAVHGSGEYYRKPGIKNLVFSPDYKHVGFDACPTGYDGPWYVVVDGFERGPYVNLAQGRLTFAEGTGQVAYQALRPDRKWAVLRDGVECGVHDGVMYLGFSPGGKHLVWTTKVGDGEAVYSDKVKGRKFEAVDSETFSPNGERLAYRAKLHGTWRVVLDQTECRAYEGIGQGSLIFSGDSQHIAYVAGERGKFLVVIDTTESERYDGLQEGSLIMSPDGRFVAYQATRRGQAVQCVNQQESLPYDGFLSKRKSIYCQDNTLHAIAARGGRIFRVDICPEP